MATETYIIAEVGQNHNGDMALAKHLIDMASTPIFDKFENRQLRGVNAVKFTKRDMSEEISVDEYKRPYDSPHAFGRTYGEHREALELSYDQHAELEAYARDKGLDFVETLTSIKTIKLLDRINVDAIKVASRDLTNLPLLEELARVGKRMIVSTGMSGRQELDDALEVIVRHHEDIQILHCVSQYPASYANINLLSIPFLKKTYPYDIGFSDHSIGIVMAPVAVGLGATIVEKHITLNREMKGSDHRASLEPEGLWRMVRDIRNVETAMGTEEKTVPDVVASAKLKLERSLATARDVAAGEAIAEADLAMLSPGHGMRWVERDRVVGKKAARAIPKGTILSPEDLQ